LRGEMARTIARLFYFWVPLGAYAAAIFWLSSMSHPVPALAIPHLDKLLHLLEYAGFGFLACRALALGGQGLSGRAALVAAATLGALYGASDELHQLYVPARAADIFDWMADITGATLGGLIYRIAALRPAGKAEEERTR
jgi:VanZ family protein